MSAGPATMPAAWRRLRRAVRPLVVATSGWPGLGAFYRGVYALQIQRARRTLRGERTVLLRGSARRRPRPGLTDLDLVVLLEEMPAGMEQRVVGETVRAVRRINRLAPLIRDVAFLSRDDVRALAALDATFLAVVELDHEGLVRGPQDLAAWIADAPRPTAEHSAVSMRHEVGYWVHKAVRQWLREPEPVGSALAGRSLAKARLYLEGHETAREATRAQPRVSAPPADARALATMLARVDDALGEPRPRRPWGLGRPGVLPPGLPPGRWEMVGHVPVCVIEPGVDALERARSWPLAWRRRARMMSPRQLARRAFYPSLGLAPGPDTELDDVEARWIARSALLERWALVRERLVETPPEPFDLVGAWRLAELDGEPPAADGYAALRDAVARISHS